MHAMRLPTARLLLKRLLLNSSGRTLLAACGVRQSGHIAELAFRFPVAVVLQPPLIDCCRIKWTNYANILQPPSLASPGSQGGAILAQVCLFAKNS